MDTSEKTLKRIKALRGKYVRNHARAERIMKGELSLHSALISANMRTAIYEVWMLAYNIRNVHSAIYEEWLRPAENETADCYTDRMGEFKLLIIRQAFKPVSDNANTDGMRISDLQQYDTVVELETGKFYLVDGQTSLRSYDGATYDLPFYKLVTNSFSYVPDYVVRLLALIDNYYLVYVKDLK